MSKETPPDKCPHCGADWFADKSRGRFVCHELSAEDGRLPECYERQIQRQTEQLRQAHAALRQIADKWVPRPLFFASPDPDDCYEYANIVSDMQDIAKEALASAPDGEGHES